MIPCNTPFSPLAACSLLAMATTVPTVTPKDFLYGVSNDGEPPLPFRYFVPPGYDPAQAYPLILFLHGAGERGEDNEAQLINEANGAMRLLDDANLALQPIFMVAPQCPVTGWWSGAPLQTAIAIVDQIAAEYRIDPDRIYVTGPSMGGVGTWNAATAHAHRFAAAVPISGSGDASAGVAARVRAIPFWFFHAANDPIVDVSGSDDLVTALRAAGANTVYTRYDDGAHGIFFAAYTHPLLFPWLVAQRRGIPAETIPPALRIVQPTGTDTWPTEAATVDLAGSADLGSFAIDAVNWEVDGGAAGIAEGVTNWSIAGLDLAAGINRIRVIATAPSGNAQWGGHTTFNDHLRVARVGPPPATGTVVAAINAGGGTYLAVDGTLYVSDTAFDGGNTSVSTRAVGGTDDDALYSDWRWGEFGYHVALPPGPYVVELHFAETYYDTVGQRVFDVWIGNQHVLEEFDIVAEVGADTALVRRFGARVDDGVLDLVLTDGRAGRARLDALRVVRADGEAIFADGFEKD